MGTSQSALKSTGSHQLSYALTFPMNRGKNLSCYYINLDKRTDRRQELESELQRMHINGVRFPAIVNKKGLIGCAQSHIACVKKGLDSGADHILVFEDDFYFIIEPDLMKLLLQNVMETSYDMFLLGYCVADTTVNVRNTNNPLFKKIDEALCAHGYLVSKEYAPKLLKNFEDGLKKLLKTDKDTSYAIDQYWKLLQDDDMWLCYSGGPCGLQRGGYSDIEQKVKPKSITDIKTWR